MVKVLNEIDQVRSQAFRSSSDPRCLWQGAASMGHGTITRKNQEKDIFGHL
jgi:hypothetical protein